MKRIKRKEPETVKSEEIAAPAQNSMTHAGIFKTPKTELTHSEKMERELTPKKEESEFVRFAGSGIHVYAFKNKEGKKIKEVCVNFGETFRYVTSDKDVIEKLKDKGFKILG